MKSTETKSMVLLHHHLKALRLPTIGSECEKVASQAAADNVDHLAYLLQLCELELLERERKAADRRMKAARFPTMKSLDNFDFTGPPVGQQDADRRAGQVRVHRQARERAPGREPGHRQVPPGHRPRRGGVCQGLQGAVLPGHGAGDHTDRGQGRTELPAPEDPAGEVRPARPR